jgi:hypothetical protein
MTKKILKLKEKYDQVLKTTSEMRANAEAKLQAELDEVFAKDEELNQAFIDAEGSTEFANDGCGIYTWIRYDIPDKYKEYGHYLSNYVSEQGFNLDLQYGALYLYQGECIIINVEGDIFLADDGRSKVIIHHNEYGTKAERNKLIEEWMEKEGYFPAVLYQGYYGDLHLVNTQTKEVLNGN